MLCCCRTIICPDLPPNLRQMLATAPRQSRWRERTMATGCECLLFSKPTFSCREAFRLHGSRVRRFIFEGGDTRAALPRFIAAKPCTALYFLPSKPKQCCKCAAFALLFFSSPGAKVTYTHGFTIAACECSWSKNTLHEKGSKIQKDNNNEYYSISLLKKSSIKNTPPLKAIPVIPTARSAPCLN